MIRLRARAEEDPESVILQVLGTFIGTVDIVSARIRDHMRIRDQRTYLLHPFIRIIYDARKICLSCIRKISICAGSEFPACILKSLNNGFYGIAVILDLFVRVFLGRKVCRIKLLVPFLDLVTAYDIAEARVMATDRNDAL